VDDNGGFLNLLDGVINVDGGILSAANDQLVVDAAPPLLSTGVRLRLINGATCTLNAPVATFRALMLGNTQNGSLEVTGTGSKVTVTAGDIIFGNVAGAFGDLSPSISGAISFPSTRNLTVGNFGRGRLINTGGTITGGNLNIGTGATGEGQVESFFGSITLSGFLAVGGTQAAAGGTGSFVVGSNSTVNLNTGATEAARVWPDGSLTIAASGLLDSSFGSIDADGAFTLEGGTLTTLALCLKGTTSPYSLQGVLNGELLLSFTTVTANLTGPLTLNPSSSGGDTLGNFGTLNVGNNTLTINDPSTSLNRLNNCTLGVTGRIDGTAKLRVEVGKTFSGDGTIANDITNSGQITAAGDGLAFEGLVTGIGQGMSGPKFTFKSGGGFIGAGSINAQVGAESGSTLTFTGRPRSARCLATASKSVRSILASRRRRRNTTNVVSSEVLSVSDSPAKRRNDRRSLRFSSSCGSERLNHLASITHRSMVRAGHAGAPPLSLFLYSVRTGRASFSQGTVRARSSDSAEVLGPPRSTVIESISPGSALRRSIVRSP